MRYRLEINNNKCDDCGLCTGNNYISDENNGKPFVNKSIVSEEEKDNVQNLVDICPVRAISLSELEQLTMESCRNKIEQMISEFSLEMPSESEFAYDKKYAVYSLDSPSDEEWQFNYNSRDEAKSAGCRCFERNVLSERTNCIRQILNNYSIDKLAPYLEYKECSGNFYYEAIKKAEQILKKAYELVIQVAEGYPEMPELITIDTRLTNDNRIRYNKSTLDDIILKAYSICDRIRRNTGERFRSYIDVNYKLIEKQTLLGTREKEKYAFYGLYQAVGEVRKDINTAVEDNFYNIVQTEVYNNIKIIVEEFEKILVEDMKNKMDSIMADAKEYIAEGSSVKSRYFDSHNTVSESSDYSGKFGNNIKEFSALFSLKTGETLSIVSNIDGLEKLVLARIPEEDSGVRFDSVEYYEEYAIVLKKYYNLDRCDFIRINLLNGKMEIMLKDVYMDGSIEIGYNDNTYAWWWYGHELYLWNAKEKKTKSVMTSYSGWCRCIGSNSKYAYICQDGCFKYSYLTGEYEKISNDNWTSNIEVRNNELYYTTKYLPRKLCNEEEGCICNLPSNALENLNANDDYIVWYQQGEGFYDRDIYVYNRGIKQYKKVLSFSIENAFNATIYFWIRKDTVQIVCLDDARWGHDKVAHKWIVSLDGALLSQYKESITNSKEQILAHYKAQRSLQKILPDIFFDE